MAAARKDQIKTVSDLLIPLVNQAGESAYAYNQETKEAVVYHWSADSSVGKKFVYSSGFECVKRKMAKNSVPVYDHYKVGFNFCDMFNKALHDKNWPFKHGGRNRSGAAGSITDYLFTCTLVNTWHAFANVQKKTASELPFQFFTENLALSMVAAHM